MAAANTAPCGDASRRALDWWESARFHLSPLAPPAHLPRTQVRGGQVCGKVQAGICVA